MRLIKYIKHLTKDQLTKDSLTSIFAQFSNSIFSLITAIMFARMLGVSEFGAYTVAFAWATMLSVLGRIGLDSYLIRELSIQLNQKNWSHSIGMLVSTLMLILAASSTLALAVYMTFVWIDPDIDTALKRLIGYSCFLIPAFSLEKFLHSILRAAGHNSAAVLTRFVIRPCLLIIVLASAYIMNYHYTGLEAILSQLATILVASALLITAIILLLPKHLFRSKPILNVRIHLKGGMRFLAIAGLGIVVSSTDIVMLGFLSTADEAGMYQVANRVASVVALTMIAVSLPLGPKLALLYRSTKYMQLKMSYYRANLLSFGLALPLGIIFMVFSEELLSIFGTEFQAASPLLVFLVIIALFDVFIGPAALCLTMMGKEKTVTRVLMLASTLNIALNLLLIPEHGAMGAIIASAFTILVLKLLIWFVLYQELRIIPGGLGLILSRVKKTGTM